MLQHNEIQLFRTLLKSRQVTYTGDQHDSIVVMLHALDREEKALLTAASVSRIQPATPKEVAAE
jgi:hypothetical protein